MKTAEQCELMRDLCDRVRDSLLVNADRWPAAWDGHELRELAAFAFDHERSALLRPPRNKRRLDCINEIIVRNLY